MTKTLKSARGATLSHDALEHHIHICVLRCLQNYTCSTKHVGRVSRDMERCGAMRCSGTGTHARVSFLYAERRLASRDHGTCSDRAGVLKCVPSVCAHDCAYHASWYGHAALMLALTAGAAKGASAPRGATEPRRASPSTLPARAPQCGAPPARTELGPN